jgi:predicted alpha/beta hydrolase family esterase
MRTADLEILIVPGFDNSGPDHWQSRWEAKLSTARRVIMPDWNRATRGEWAGAVAEAVSAAKRPVVLVGHSLGCAAIVHAARDFASQDASAPVLGAFLVAPSNVERKALTKGISRDFAPLPREPLPFPSLLVASRNDPFCDFATASSLALAWGSALGDAGEAGHINPASGYGPWPEGLMQFAGFLKRLPAG